MPKPERVAVIFGGRSVEHEVSVITGHQAMDALDVAGFDVLPVYITKSGEWYGGRPLHNLRLYADRNLDPARVRDVFRVSLSPDRSVRGLVAATQPGRLFGRPPDLWADVFFPTVHGSHGEDGTLQGLFELADVPYTGAGVLASAIAMDKVQTKALFRAAELSVIDCLVVTRDAWVTDRNAVVASVGQFCGYPAMAKPVSLGSSIGVVRCTDDTVLGHAVEAGLLLDERVLIERALHDFVEINCSVLGPPTRTSVCEQPVTGNTLLSFDDKYRRGAKAGRKQAGKRGMAGQERLIPAPVPNELTARVQSQAARAFDAIGAAGVARVDFLYEPMTDALYVNEVNTMPGSLAFYLWEATGVPFDVLVTELVRIAKTRHAAKSATQVVFDANLLAPPQP